MSHAHIYFNTSQLGSEVRTVNKHAPIKTHDAYRKFSSWFALSGGRRASGANGFSSPRVALLMIDGRNGRGETGRGPGSYLNENLCLRIGERSMRFLKRVSALSCLQQYKAYTPHWRSQ